MPSSSLYVGDLHPDVTEKDLTETFATAGPLLSVHLCRDKFSGKSLCYAYVNFWLPCFAFNALKCLNHTLLRGKSMRIMWYDKNAKARKNGIGNLFVKNLAPSITSVRLENTFSKYGTILSCKIVEENGISKGYGYVQFNSEDSAMAALRALHDTMLEGKKLYVSKFRRKTQRNGAVNYRNKDTSTNIVSYKFPDQEKVASAVTMKDNKEKSNGCWFINSVSHEEFKKAMVVADEKLKGSKNFTVGKALKKDGNHFKKSKDSDPIVRNLDTSADYSFPQFRSPIPFLQQWLPTFVSPFNPSNLFQAHNFYTSPIQLATLYEPAQKRYLEMAKGGGITRREFHAQFVARNGKGFNSVTFSMRASPEIQKSWPHEHCWIHKEKVRGTPIMLKGKLDNEDEKKLLNGSDTTKTLPSISSPDVHKNFQTGNADITPRPLGVH